MRARERLVHAVARERVDEAGGIADGEHPAARDLRARAAHRQPVAAQLGQRLPGDAVTDADVAQVIAQVRALRVPAADADVGVVALREDPAVAARDVAHLEQRDVPLDARADGVVGDVGLERGGEDAILAELERPSADAVGAVGGDEDVGARTRAVAERDARPPLAVELDLAHLRAVAERRAGERRLLGEEGVEPLALRHQHDRREPAVLERSEIAVAEGDRRHALLHDRPDRERQQPGPAQRDAAAAGLVAGEARAVDEQRAHALAGEQMRGQRARRPGPHHDDVETLHDWSVRSGHGRQQRSSRGCRRPAGAPGHGRAAEDGLALRQRR